MKARLFALLSTLWPAGILALLAGLEAAAHVALQPDVLEWRDGWMLLFGFVATGVISWLICRAFLPRLRFGDGSAAAQLFSAGLAASLLFWGIPALVIWLGVRSRVQDHLQNPWYPSIALPENGVQVGWIVIGIGIMALFLYAHVGRSNGEASGMWLLTTGLLVGVSIYLKGVTEAWWSISAVIAVGCMAGVLDLAARRLIAHKPVPAIPDTPADGSVTLLYGSRRWRVEHPEALLETVAAICLAWLYFSSAAVDWGNGWSRPSFRDALFFGSRPLMLALAVAAIAFAARGRARAAGELVLLMVFASLWTGHSGGEWLPPPAEKPGRIIFMLEDPAVRGADLWINGRRVGTLPLTLTDEQYKEWTRPPDTSPGRSPEVCIPCTDGYPCPALSWSSFDDPLWPSCTWLPLPLPAERYDRNRAWADGVRSRTPGVGLRVRLGGEWGVLGGDPLGASDGWTGNWPIGTPQNQGIAQVRVRPLPARFPEREERLRALINQARVRNYAVSPEWLTAIDSYGDDGWQTLRQGADADPRLLQLLDVWARWRYQIPAHPTPEQAWQILQRIAREAESEKEYFTASAAGRAVEVVTPFADLDRVEKWAESALPLLPVQSPILLWHENGGWQFGWSNRIEGFYPWVDDPQFSVSPIRNSGGCLRRIEAHAPYEWGDLPSPGLPMGTCVAGHALYAAWQQSSGRGERLACLQQRLAPAILRARWWDSMALQLAAAIGGSEVETFLRRSWKRAEHDKREGMRFPGINMFGYTPHDYWQGELAMMPGTVGREFRTEHAEELMQLAKKGLIATPFPVDPELGDNCLAFRYFRRCPPEGMLRWIYLVQCEPLTSPAMYVDAANPPGSSFSSIREKIESAGFSLPLAKRKQVLRLLEADVDRRPVPARDGDAAEYRSWAKQNLRYALLPEASEVTDLVETCEKHSSERRQQISGWLKLVHPENMAVVELARSSDPVLRALAPPALARYAPPDRQSILHQLTSDPDPAVRRAASKAEDEVRTLRATSPGRLASGG